MVPRELRDKILRLLDEPGNYNCVDLWDEEEDAGFVYITDDDLHIAVTVGWQEGVEE